MESFALFLPLVQEELLAEISTDSCVSPTSVLMLHAHEFSYVQILKKEHVLKAVSLHLTLISCSKLLPQQDHLMTKAISSTVLGFGSCWNTALVLIVL